MPYIPKLKGQETFPGKILHSHNYRRPEDFKDSTVVCVGMGASGQDISLDLYPHAKKIYISHGRDVFSCKLPSNIEQVEPIESLHGNKVKFTDGQTSEVDVIILCTGYEYSFPFLTKECHVTVKDKQVSPLYKHVIHTGFPNLSFIGLPSINIPFLTINSQVNFAVAVLDRSYRLPSRDQMELDAKQDLQKRLAIGWSQRHAHKLSKEFVFVYEDEINKLIGVPPMKPVLRKLWDEYLHCRWNNLWHFKLVNYVKINDEDWDYADK